MITCVTLLLPANLNIMTSTTGSRRPAASARAPGQRAASPRKPAKRAPKAASTGPSRQAKPVTAAPLTATQRRYLRGLCHALKPLVMLGNKGLTDSVKAELEATLAHHELVKIKLSGGDREERQQQLDELLAASRAELVQQIGHVVSVFRRNVDQPRLALPA